MKADVAPPTISLELDVPPWVPDSIAQFVRAKYAADVRWVFVEAKVRAASTDIVREDLAEIADRYCPLVCDHRMRGVWQELSRAHNGAFLHPARRPAVANLKERQAAAMLELFKLTLDCRNYLRWPVPPTRTKAERQRRYCLAKAKELERDALIMATRHLTVESALRSGDSTDIKKRYSVYETLQAAANIYKQGAHALSRARSSLPERDCDTRARLVAVTIGDKFRTLFGSPMYGLTATIASVVLNRQIDPGTARHWCAPHPAVKPQKIAR